MPDAAIPNPGDLERGDIGVWPAAAFFTLSDADRHELLALDRDHAGTKDVSFDPATQCFSGRRVPPAAGLTAVLTRFAEASAAWLAGTFPAYAGGLTPDRVTWHGAEEATRPLRHTARNDLLHVDNFSTRPANGRRLLRLFLNVNPADAQVWATSERFPALLARYRARHATPARPAADWLAGGRWLGLFPAGRSAYDAQMQRLHHFLKNNHHFQVTAPRRLWTFPPGAAWLAFTDGVSYAWLRGCGTLEQSFFVSQDALHEPAESPLAHLCRAEPDSPLSMAG